MFSRKNASYGRSILHGQQFGIREIATGSAPVRCNARFAELDFAQVPEESPQLPPQHNVL